MIERLPEPRAYKSAVDWSTIGGVLATVLVIALILGALAIFADDEDTNSCAENPGLCEVPDEQYENVPMGG